MAIPRVFISSTCYDLRYIRENLKFFVRNMGFEPVLSEEGNVFYDPKLHVQDACLAEVSTCQMFVLIIGGHFGTTFKQATESITNHEYREAVKAKVPIFALVEQQTYAEYSVYCKNKENLDIDATKISYPSVDSILIFDFMDEVRGSAVNNALVPFSDFSELESYLKQQWAGMMFNFLSQEGESKRVADMLEALTAMSDRIEFLSRQILSSVGTDIAKLTAQIYDIMLRYECIRDLAFIGIRPSPKDIIQTEDYVSLGKGKIRIDPIADDYSVSGSGEFAEERLELNKQQYKELRTEVLNTLSESGKNPADFVREIYTG
jgi:hypothetical protein